MWQTLRGLVVDRDVREQADAASRAAQETQETQETQEEARVPGTDPCVHVFPSGGVPRLARGASDASDVTLGTSLFRDVDVHTSQGAGSRALFEVLDGTTTLGGRACLRALLDAPTCDVHLLEARQQTLRALSELVTAEAPRASLQTLRATEADVVWMLDHPGQDEETRGLYEMAFFKMWPLRRLNASPASLTAMNLYRIAVSPTLGILSPIILFVVPYLVLRGVNRLRIPFTTYVRAICRSWVASMSQGPTSARWARCASAGFSLLFYFQGLFNSVELSSALSSVCTSICRRDQRVEAFRRSAASLVRWCRPLGGRIRESFFPDTAFTIPSPPSSSEGGAGQFQAGWNFGLHLASFKGFDRDGCARLMRDAYAVDALVAVLHAKAALRACDVQYVGGLDPARAVFDARGLRHPCLAPDGAVVNPLCIDSSQEGGANAVLLTGPNAGGKSTLLKATLLAAILAQTLTIAPCDSLRITPFGHIHSHINVPDVNGSMSLFEAEMARALESMDVVDRLGRAPPGTPGRLALIVMDEVFSSTNPVEGIAGAYAVSKNLAENPHVALIVSTHFLYLRKLASTSTFKLLQMPVAEDPSSKRGFGYPYRVVPGVCEQLIALELLRAKGFCDRVIGDAVGVKRELLLSPGHRGRLDGVTSRRQKPRSADGGATSRYGRGRRNGVNARSISANANRLTSATATVTTPNENRVLPGPTP